MSGQRLVDSRCIGPALVDHQVTQGVTDTCSANRRKYIVHEDRLMLYMACQILDKAACNSEYRVGKSRGPEVFVSKKAPLSAYNVNHTCTRGVASYVGSTLPSMKIILGKLMRNTALSH